MTTLRKLAVESLLIFNKTRRRGEVNMSKQNVTARHGVEVVVVRTKVVEIKVKEPVGVM